MKHAPTLLALLALLPGCTLAQVDATVDDVCLTYPNLAVPGAAPATVAGSGAIAQSFVFRDLGPVHQLLQYDAQLAFVHAEIRTSETDALAGIRRATVGIAGAGSGSGSSLPRAVVYACDANCVEVDASLQLPAQTVSDALAYLSADALAVDLAATGALPAHPWTMDVDVCVSGHAHYALQP